MQHRTQNGDIIDHLAKGKTLTAAQAYAKFGCLRLAARIAELRKVVHIETTLIWQGSRHWAQYRIAK